MVRTTLIARLMDGLPLAASMDDEEGVRTYSLFSMTAQEDLREYKNQAKELLRRMSTSQESRCSIESGVYVLQYTIHMRD